MEANAIWQRINCRDLYKLMHTLVSKNQLDTDKITKNIDLTKLRIFKSKIGFVSGSKDNPLNHVFYYNKQNSNICGIETTEHISFLVSKIYQEYIYMYFLINKDSDIINKLKQNIINDV